MRWQRMQMLPWSDMLFGAPVGRISRLYWMIQSSREPSLRHATSWCTLEAPILMMWPDRASPLDIASATWNKHLIFRGKKHVLMTVWLRNYTVRQHKGPQFPRSPTEWQRLLLQHRQSHYAPIILNSWKRNRSSRYNSYVRWQQCSRNGLHSKYPCNQARRYLITCRWILKQVQASFD